MKNQNNITCPQFELNIFILYSKNSVEPHCIQLVKNQTLLRMPSCDVCNICCPSEYQMKQHLSGRKHAEMLKGGGEIKGICFEYRDKGYCSRRNYCSYNHLDSFGSSLCMPVSVSYQKNSLLKSRS